MLRCKVKGAVIELRETFKHFYVKEVLYQWFQGQVSPTTELDSFSGFW